jgi:hypothetical protein
MGPEILIPISFFFAAAFVVRSVLQYKERKNELEARMRGMGGLESPRLERIEQAIDAVAVEIERIAESQRFVTRLLSEPRGEAGTLPRPNQPR